MYFNLQPSLSNQLVSIQPLQPGHFDALYSVASDALLWEQHPNKDRYKKEVFENFFTGAMASVGAFLVKDNLTGKVIGSSRFYDLDEAEKLVAIGYTFISRDYWGKGYNMALKKLMLDHAFQYADRVIFHIGAYNIRSQKAIGHLGAIKIGEQEIAYFGEPEKLNFIFEIKKKNWN